MSENIVPGPVIGSPPVKEAVCIHTMKIYDSCKQKDCLQDRRVYLTQESQAAADKAVAIKCTNAKIIWVYTDVEPVPFNGGFYTIDLRYYYYITAEAYICGPKPCQIEGIAVADKRVFLFGGEGQARSFSSQSTPCCGEDIPLRPGSNLPVAVVEVVNPIVLGTKLLDNGVLSDETDLEIPEKVCGCLGGQITHHPDCKKLYVTLGQFSIIRLERDTQLLIPSYSFCIPEKECVEGNEEDPCNIFEKIRFPNDEFFPPRPTPTGGPTEGTCRE